LIEFHTADDSNVKISFDFALLFGSQMAVGAFNATTSKQCYFRLSTTAGRKPINVEKYSK